MSNPIEDLCLAPSQQTEILQGNIAFAVGCVRGGVHSVDGYPGTPSSEVIDRGLSSVQNLIQVGWSVNEAVAAGVGHGHSLAGRDCVVTMKIPGLYQAGDIFSSGAMYIEERGALVYYIASDFTPSSTQHVIDPRYFFKSCFTPVFEPRNHQELHEAAALAVEISRKYRTQIVVMPNGNLCHSEGLVHLMPVLKREPVPMPESLRAFNVLPGIARKNFDQVMSQRMPALKEMVETSPLNYWEKGAGKIGVITYGMSDAYLHEVKLALAPDLDVLSLAFTNPLPMDLIRAFHASIHGPVYIIEDGYQYLQEAVEQAGLPVIGKEPFSSVTEWSPDLIAKQLGLVEKVEPISATPALPRPPMICAGCPYRLFVQEVNLLRKKKQIDVVFGDIGCNALLYFMNALDTGLAMGASEANRSGYVLSRPEQAARCLSVIGDSTECHSGMDATRNTIYRNAPGVKVILDNSWTAMTGGQPSPTSPANLAGQSIPFNLAASLKAHGANVIEAGAYDKKEIRKALTVALSAAEHGVFSTVIVNDGACIQQSRRSQQRVSVDPDVCKKCGACLICQGLEAGPDGVPHVNYLCSGCAGATPSCVQMCPTHVLKVVDGAELENKSAAGAHAVVEPPVSTDVFDHSNAPQRLRLAIRGVGGQGNLFFGHVLSRLAFLAGYSEENIIKGETHGMAQMGGPVISTFGCGDVISPLPLAGTCDCLITMEKSEILRPGFLETLKADGFVLMANTQILPSGIPENQYPTDDTIRKAVNGRTVFEVDVLDAAVALGDSSGRSANVVMLGVLSRIGLFQTFPEDLWLEAIYQTNPKPAVWSANAAAFKAGRNLANSIKTSPGKVQEA